MRRSDSIRYCLWVCRLGLGFFFSEMSSVEAQSLRIDGFFPVRGSAGETVRLDGSGFVGAHSVTFNGVPAPFSVTANTQIIATIPAQASSGQIVVRVGGSIAISADSFRIFAPGPRPLSVTPTSGPVGSIIEIQGERFTANTFAFFPPDNIVALTSVPSENRLQAVVPEGAESGPIIVANTIGFNATDIDFRITQRVDLSVGASPGSVSASVGLPETIMLEIRSNGGTEVENARVFLTLPNPNLTFLGSPSPSVLETQNLGSIIQLDLEPVPSEGFLPVELHLLATEAFGEILVIAEVDSDETEIRPADNAAGVAFSALEVAHSLSASLLESGLIRLDWPRYPESLVLEWTSATAPANWLPVEATPSETDTGRWIEMEASEGAAFFRLAR